MQPNPTPIHWLKSTALGNERRIWVTPPAEAKAVSPLVIFLDGELYRDRVGVPEIIDDLVTARSIADAWWVWVSMESEEARWKECPCYPPFAEFVGHELLAFLAAAYPATRQAQQRILVGLSYTGLAAVFVAGETGKFDRVIAQSGSFWWKNCWLTHHVTRVDSVTRTAFYLDVGTQETQQNVQHRYDVLQVVSQLEGVCQMRDALLSRGHPVVYREYVGGHDFAAWRATLPGALTWALGRGSPNGIPGE